MASPGVQEGAIVIEQRDVCDSPLRVGERKIAPLRPARLNDAGTDADGDFRSGCPHRACALTVDGNSADISNSADKSTSANTKLRIGGLITCPTKSATPNAGLFAWIGKAVRVEGKVISEEDLTIDGDVEG